MYQKQSLRNNRCPKNMEQTDKAYLMQKGDYIKVAAM